MWLGSANGNVVSWSDTEVVATVASAAVTGIARIQQDGVWSNALAFTVPSANDVTLAPNLLNLVVGETHAIQALNSAGQPVTGLPWASSNTNVVSLSSADPPVLTAVGAGHATITAGSGSADVTVHADALPQGTVLWSNPGASGSPVLRIVPAVPSSEGVADVFAFHEDGTVDAITSEGITAWTADVSQGFYWYPGNILPDFRGGLVFHKWEDGSGLASLVRLDGATGQAITLHTRPSNADWHYARLGVHPDGTVFATIEEQIGPSYAVRVLGFNPEGGQKFSVTTPPISGYPGWFFTYSMIVAGDGYAYVPYSYMKYDVSPGYQSNHLRLLRVDSAGASSEIDLHDWTSTDNSSGPMVYDVNLITNADQGVLASWQSIYSLPWDGPVEYQRHMAVVSGGGASVGNLPGTSEFMDSVAPVLQLEDGSFVGAVWDYISQPAKSMFAFDASGALRWSVAGYEPQVATAGGGVIATTESGSAVTFDSTGAATGQMGSLFTQSWLGHPYQVGSTLRLVAFPYYIATSFWPWALANSSGNGASVRADWFPALDRCTTTPGCIGPHEAIYNALDDLIARLADPALKARAQQEVFSKVGTTADNFVQYLTQKRPGFYNGLKSGYCYSALTPQDDNAFCNWWILGGLRKSIAQHLEGHPTTDAVTGTPGSPLRVFFRPSAILYNNLGRNLGNEGTIFHEALHGLTGRQDEQLLEDLGYVPWSEPSCKITTYIQENVLRYSTGLDPAVTACP